MLVDVHSCMTVGISSGQHQDSQKLWDDHSCEVPVLQNSCDNKQSWKTSTTPWRGTPPVGSCRCYILFEWRFHSCALSSYIPSTRLNYIRLFKIVFRSNETTTPPSPFVTYKSFGVPKRDCIHDRPRRLQIDGTDPNRPDLQLPLADFFWAPHWEFHAFSMLYFTMDIGGCSVRMYQVTSMHVFIMCLPDLPVFLCVRLFVYLYFLHRGKML